MRIQHNIMAMNAFRNYNTNTSALGRNLEKLSSGYKINRAGDDAAGLAISEKMRAQISGLKQAQSNVKDGISLVKTAEGALQEVQDMLNRMTTLATQSANGTYSDKVDRENLQKEVEALAKEIDRIAEASNFNGTKLLNGDLAGAKVDYTDGVKGTASAAAKPAKFEIDLGSAAFTGDADDKIKLTIKGVSISKAAGGTSVNAAGIATLFNNSPISIAGQNFTITNSGTKLVFTATKAGTAGNVFATTDTLALAGVSAGSTAAATAAITGYTSPAAVAVVTAGASAVAKVSGTAAKAEIDFTGMTGADVIGGKLEIGDKKVQFIKATGDPVEADHTGVVVAASATASAIVKAITDASLSVTKFTLGKDTSGKKLTVTETVGSGAVPAGISAPTIKQEGFGGLRLQIGDSADSYNQMSVRVGDMHAAALKVDAASINVKTQEAAADAIQKIKDAINTVSSTRGDLGAIQNRLEHTTNNLAIMTENIQDAESTIRDVDIADEMTTYTKNNILLQSAQAMLAQANQMPQGVLQLLQ